MTTAEKVNSVVLGRGTGVDVWSVLVVPDSVYSTLARWTRGLFKPELNLNPEFVRWWRDTSFRWKNGRSSRLVFFGIAVPPAIQEHIREIIAVPEFTALFGNDLRFYATAPDMHMDMRRSFIREIFVATPAMVSPQRKILLAPWMNEDLPPDLALELVQEYEKIQEG